MDKTIEYYDDQAESFVAGTVSVDFSIIQEEFTVFIPKGGRILDLGCGSGRDSKAFMNMGYQVVAMDASRELCKLASNYIGQDVTCATFQNFEPEGLFDGIWACASLLHLDRESIKMMLRKYAGRLNPNGVFYASFKYGSYSGMRNGRFFTDLQEQSLEEILKTIPELKIVRLNISEDVRKDRASEKWLNVFMKRATPVNSLQG